MRHFGRVCLAVLLSACSCVGGCKNSTESQPQLPTEEKATLETAAKAIQTQRWEVAEKLVRELTVASPDDLQVGLLRIQLSTARGLADEAAEELLRLADLHAGESHLLRAQAAELKFESQQYQAAFKILRRLLADQPQRYQIRSRFAEMLNARGFRHEANDELRYLAGRIRLTTRELVALINPTSTWVAFAERPDLTDPAKIHHSGALSVVAALRSRGEFRDALRVLTQSEEFKQALPTAVATHGWLLALNQEEEQLKAWARSAPKTCRDYPSYWLALGSLLLREEPSIAKDCYVIAFQLEPHCTEAVEGIAQSLQSLPQDDQLQAVRQRRVDLAEIQSLARKIATDSSVDPALGIEMGRLLNAVGRPIESLAWQETVIARVAPTAAQLTVLHEHKKKVLEKQPTGRVDALASMGFEHQPIDELLAKLPVANDQVSRSTTEQVIPKPATPVFVEVAESLGIDFRYQNAPQRVTKAFRLFESLGSGLACLDYDLDGGVDLYFGQAGGEPPEQLSAHSNKLFRSRSKRFVDVTMPSGAESFHYSLGVTSGDWNQDGFPDLMVGNLGINELWINQGDGTFREIDFDSHWREPMFTASVAIADIDGDALPDMIESNYVDDENVFRPIEYDRSGSPVLLPGPKQFQPARDRTFLSSGNGEARMEFLGKKDAASTGLGLLVTDLNGDSQNEVFVANDQNPNHLWVRDATWQDAAPTLGIAYGPGGRPMACMGIAAADFDGNGRLDLHITNFLDESSNFYLQQETGDFVDRSIAYQLDRSTVQNVGFGTQALDYDNNSTSDLIIGNGHIEDLRDQGKPFAMKTQLLSRTPSGFELATVGGGEAYWAQPHLARGVVLADWNHDGRVDVVVTDLDRRVALLENRTEDTGHWLHLRLVGTISERDAIGARVTVRHPSGTIRTQVQTGDGYLCKNEARLFIGLGDSDSVLIEIDWPSAKGSPSRVIASTRE